MLEQSARMRAELSRRQGAPMPGVVGGGATRGARRCGAASCAWAACAVAHPSSLVYGGVQGGGGPVSARARCTEQAAAVRRCRRRRLPRIATCLPSSTLSMLKLANRLECLILVPHGSESKVRQAHARARATNKPRPAASACRAEAWPGTSAAACRRRSKQQRSRSS